MGITILALLSVNSFAGVNCSENITSVILHKNSELYFKSSVTCPNTWCQVTWSGEGDKDRVFSMLLTAKTASKKVTIYWEQIDNCDQENAMYASPGYIMY